MAAPLDNSFWKLRADMSEDGRKLSVKQVIEGIKAYIERTTNHRLYEVDFIGQRAQEVHKPKIVAMSIYGACVQLGINHVTWIEWRKDQKYSKVLLMAEDIFKTWNIEGSSAGFLNQSIIARLEGLKDSTDVTSGGKELKGLTVKWGDEEINL